MKKLSVALLLVATIAGLSGCITSQTGNKTVDPIVLSTVAQEAAAIGTQVWLAQHPEDRDKFMIARTSLRALVAVNSGSVADLQAALSALPIDQLKGTQGAVIVSGAVVLLDAAGKEIAKLDSKDIYGDYVKPVAQGLLAGLDQALGS